MSGQSPSDPDPLFEMLDLDKLKQQAVLEQQHQILVWIVTSCTTLTKLKLIDSQNQLFVKRSLDDLLDFFEIEADPEKQAQPNRSIRASIGKLYQILYSFDEKRELYEAVNKLITIMNNGKADKYSRLKHAAIIALGSIFLTSGGSVISLAPLTAASLAKICKSSLSHSGFKGSALLSLSYIVDSTGFTFDDSLIKDVWKLAKNATNDKGNKVASAAFNILENLIKYDLVLFKSASDFESFKTLVQKSFENSFDLVGRSAASCISQAYFHLCKTSTPIDTKVLINKRQTFEDNSEETSRVASPASSINSNKKNNYHLTFEEVMEISVSSYSKNPTTTRVKNGIIRTLATFFLMNVDVVKRNYSVVASSLLINLLNRKNIANNRYSLLVCQKHVKFLLNSIIAEKLFSEHDQITSLKWLIDNILAVNSPDISQFTLKSALDVISGLISYLGSSVSSIKDLINACLLRLLQYDDKGVIIAACYCLKTLVINVPSEIIPVTSTCINHINKEISRTDKSEGISTKHTGFVYALATLISITNIMPEYSSLDLSSRVLVTASSLLKKSVHQPLYTATVNIEMAWVLVSGVMSLGPSFVKVHLSHLLLLWKNALPKFSQKDLICMKGTTELSYLLCGKKAALGSIFSFLKSNYTLVTPDISKRIGIMLQNTLLFLNSLPEGKLSSSNRSSDNSALTIFDLEVLTRRRILQCYLELSRFTHTEVFHANLLTSALKTFANPPKARSSDSLLPSVKLIWEASDNYAEGLTSKINGFDILEMKNSLKTNMGAVEVQEKHWLSDETWDSEVADLLKSPIVDSSDHDMAPLLHNHTGEMPVSPATSIIDLSIELFTIMMPVQISKVQETILEQINAYLASCSGKDFLRNQVVVINTVTAIHGCLNYCITSDDMNESWKDHRVLSSYVEILKKIIINPDVYVRNIAAQALGLLCTISDTSFISQQINYLLDEIVANRDSDARAGLSLSLGYISKSFGGSMLFKAHVNSILNTLLFLAKDPHPEVHFWALEAISITMQSTPLVFNPFIGSTTELLSEIYLSESHDDEVSSAVMSNMEIKMPTIRVLSRCVRGIINILGPDLREPSKTRDAISVLINRLMSEDDEQVVSEASKAAQEIIVYAPGIIDIKLYSMFLYKCLASSNPYLRQAAINGLYQLMKTYSSRVFSHTGYELAQDIWMAYNETPTNKEIRGLISSWLTQTASTEANEWVYRIQALLRNSKIGFKDSKNATVVSNEPDLEADEEVEGFTSGGNSENSDNSSEPLKWQTRALAIDMLRELLFVLLKGRTQDEIYQSPLISHVGEIIKIAFTASTDHVLEIRLLGVKLIEDVLENFSGIKDPDFEEVLLLEQFQAQMGSALMPAFSADGSPKLASEAIKVCAAFVGSGIEKNVDRMGRILRLLVNSLESCSNGRVTIGDLKTDSPNGQAMLRMSILSAWAELQVLSSNQVYLINVIEPYIELLVPLWLSNLKEFAQLRFEPEESSGLSEHSMDNIFSSMNKSNQLIYHQKSWLKLVEAISSILETDKTRVFNALHETIVQKNTESNGEKEAASFFFVLFGICFEALITPPGINGALCETEQTYSILKVLKKLLHPTITGATIYKGELFAEIIDLLDRLALTSKVSEQQLIVEIAHDMCMNYYEAVGSSSLMSETQLSESVDQLFELTRVIILTLSRHLPFLADSDHPISANISKPQYVQLCRSILSYLVQIISKFPIMIRVDLSSCVLHIFERIFENPVCQDAICQVSLAPFKKLLEDLVVFAKSNNEYADSIRSEIRLIISRIVSFMQASKAAATKKNCILAAIVVVSSCAPALDPSADFVPILCDVLVSGLANIELLPISSQCIKTLIGLSQNFNIGKAFIKRLIPLLAKSISDKAGAKNMPEATKAILEILVGFTLSLSGETQIVSGLSITLPVLIWFASDDKSIFPQIPRQKYTSQKLLQLASFDSSAFKTVVQTNLSASQKAILQDALKAGRPEGDEEKVIDEGSFAVGALAGTGVSFLWGGNTTPTQTVSPVVANPGLTNGGNGAIGGTTKIEPQGFFKYGYPGPIYDVAYRQEFISSYDRRTRNPAWVVEHITADSIRKQPGQTPDRKNSTFMEDEQVPKKFRARLADYFRSGFDRGHQAPAADAKFSQSAMDETFYLTNMAPQVGEGFNRDYWAHFEDFCRRLTKKYDSVRIVTGPLYLPKRGADGKYRVSYEVIGNPPNVAVPTHFYKLVVGERDYSDSVAIAAFVMPNDKINNTTKLTDFQVPIEALERSSGLEFFTKLSDNKKKDLCREVECSIIVRDFTKALPSPPTPLGLPAPKN
ncbi:hypothetical protein NADFUDRAFT_49472 [Nadsonia fulvescens var. elongata DSM 6958]|uniref:ARM repeat-containing protein n=1 Tax=Nadsonia fulvescens var. elongata DSM 6958 TaxID=857566 RepID=A0A1E3PNZ2_9ASCO|nr:hypothetical protein NADFUDRAFT_49472 [Nadsonia fulvescens var. elongata DSM 6958]